MTAAALTPDDVLRRAAVHLARPGTWGRDLFIDPATGCRCAAGAIALAADPDDRDGDPFAVTDHGRRRAATEAAVILADYLVEELGAPCAEEVVETIGDWNDRQPGPAPVVAAMQAAADRAVRTAVA